MPVIFLECVGGGPLPTLLPGQRAIVFDDAGFTVTNLPDASATGNGQAVTGYNLVTLKSPQAALSVTGLIVTNAAISNLEVGNDADLDGDVDVEGDLVVHGDTSLQGVTTGPLSSTHATVDEFEYFVNYPAGPPNPSPGGVSVHAHGDLLATMPNGTTRTLASATPPTVTGSRGSNAAVASLLTTLATLGFIIDGSS